MSKKYIIVSAVAVVCILIVSGLFYSHYKKVKVGEFSPISVTPADVKPITKDNLVVTPTTAETSKPSTIIVKTDKDQVIKDIVDQKYDIAKTEIKTLLAANPKDAELWYIDSSLKGVLSDNAGAITSIDKAILYDAGNSIYWKWKVSLTIRKMLTDKILKTSPIYISTVKAIYENALKSTNSNIEIITPYAIFLESIGDNQQAIVYWEKAIVINPIAKQSYQTEIDRLKLKK